MLYKIDNIDYAKIKLSETRYTYANQLWYKNRWKIQAGCGPTNASQLIWYLIKSNEEYAYLKNNSLNDKVEFMKLMDELWYYITPKLAGVHSVKIFSKGLSQFLIDNSIKLEIASLDLRKKLFKKPKFAVVEKFIIESLSNNNLVAFLTLSNGKINELYNWHWTTIFEYDSSTNEAFIIDAEREFKINIKNWYESSFLGGGLVYINNNK